MGKNEWALWAILNGRVHPIAHMIFPGNFQAKTTLSSLYSRIIDLGMEPGTLVWDRGNTSADSVEEIEALGWEIICGVPKITADAKNILKNTDVPLTPECFVPSKNGDVYALQKEGKLYGKDRKVTVYVNTQKRLNEIHRRQVNFENRLPPAALMTAVR